MWGCVPQSLGLISLKNIRQYLLFRANVEISVWDLVEVMMGFAAASCCLQRWLEMTNHVRSGTWLWTKMHLMSLFWRCSRRRRRHRRNSRHRVPCMFFKLSPSLVWLQLSPHTQSELLFPGFGNRFEMNLLVVSNYLCCRFFCCVR